MEIKAHYRREERYEGMQLVFGTDEAAKAAILEAIEAVKKELGITPKVYENCDSKTPQKCAIYMEFEDEYDREGGEFFERVLRKLGIDCCS